MNPSNPEGKDILPNLYDGVFGSLPERAMRDPAFNGLTRVFIAIARRDGHGTDGRGCDAGLEQLAEDTGLNLTNISTYRNKLVRRGYAAKERNPRHRSKWIYRVIYNENALQISEVLSGEGESLCPNGKESLCPGGKMLPQSLCPDFPQPSENKGENILKRTYIKENQEENLVCDPGQENKYKPESANPEKLMLDGEVLSAQQGNGVNAPLSAKTANFPEAVILWNKFARAKGLGVVQNFTDQRRGKLTRHLKKFEGLEGWRTMLEIIGRSPHLLGVNDRGWRATFDWVLNETNFTKIMERNYERTGENKSGTQTASDKLREGIANAVMDRALAS